MDFHFFGIVIVILSSYNDGSDLSMGQGQNETPNQTQSDISQLKFLKNSTSFGNATADLQIKHAPEFSTLTIQPWPMVEPNGKFNITGTLVDKITLQSIPDSDISFLYESASEEIRPSSLKQIDNQKTDTTRKFSTMANAPSTKGIISVTAVFNGSGLYHSGASDPALVIVSNSSLPP
jgi:hypothetical protein